MNEYHERYFCRACIQDSLTREALELIDEYLRSLKKEDCTNDEEYGRRLSQCKRCASLSMGNTCMRCGCLVQIRAKKIAMDCPDPEGSRWQER